MRTCSLIAVLCFMSATALKAAELDWIQVSQDGKSFVTAKAQKPFVPWGFNYDHDRDGQLLEDYWNTDWKEIEQDFAEMKQLGANVVRIHIQFGKFMAAPNQIRPAAFKKLEELLALAERTGLYLDLTGLGCYHKQDVPAWYDQLSDKERWEAQAYFWSAVAKQCANSPAIFCYDLMNEPVVHAGKKKEPTGSALPLPASILYNALHSVPMNGRGPRLPPPGLKCWSKQFAHRTSDI